MAGPVIALTGDYGYEGYGALHTKTHFPEKTELYFSHTGTVAFMDEAGNPAGFIEETLRELAGLAD